MQPLDFMEILIYNSFEENAIRANILFLFSFHCCFIPFPLFAVVISLPFFAQNQYQNHVESLLLSYKVINRIYHTVQTEFKIVLIKYSFLSLSPCNISENLAILDRSLLLDSGPSLLLGITVGNIKSQIILVPQPFSDFLAGSALVRESKRREKGYGDENDLR